MDKKELLARISELESQRLAGLSRENLEIECGEWFQESDDDIKDESDAELVSALLEDFMRYREAESVEELSAILAKMQADANAPTYYAKAVDLFDAFTKKATASELDAFGVWFFGEESDTFTDIRNDRDNVIGQVLADLRSDAHQNGENGDNMFDVHQRLSEFLEFGISFPTHA